MMTIEKISFRDFIRGYVPADILLLLDKKSKKSRGLFVAPKYADEVLEFLKQKEHNKKEQKKHALLDFIGEFGEEAVDTSPSHQAIKAKKYE